ncbi:MAG: hypothetical protein U0T36_03060 [Saprospiraceae bacterium]
MPSLASLEAVVNAAEHKYSFFALNLIIVASMLLQRPTQTIKRMLDAFAAWMNSLNINNVRYCINVQRDR